MRQPPISTVATLFKCARCRIMRECPGRQNTVEYTFFDSCMSNQLLKNDTYSFGVAAEEAFLLAGAPKSRPPTPAPAPAPGADVVTAPAVASPAPSWLSAQDSCISTIFSASASPNRPESWQAGLVHFLLETMYLDTQVKPCIQLLVCM